MKKFFVLSVVFAFVLFFAASCSKSNDTPSSPAPTATEAAPAATSTPTATNTVGILVDDFEDNNLQSKVVCSDCVNSASVNSSGSSVIVGSGLISTGGDPVAGNYYYSLTGTVKLDGVAMISASIKTMTTNGTKTGINCGSYNNVEFSYRLKSVDTMKTRFYIYNSSYGGGIMGYYNLSNDNAWHTVTIPISSFTGDASSVMPNITDIYVSFFSVSTAYPTTDSYVEYGIDNIVLRP